MERRLETVRVRRRRVSASEAEEKDYDCVLWASSI
jgi:hypothetical protein